MMNKFEAEDSFRHKGLRRELVELLAKKGISNPKVLEAIAKVPRHLFLDSVLVNFAYEDRAMPIGEGQTISQPFTVAFQSQLLDVKFFDKVLEIGTGSGYQAAILAELGSRVYSIERQPKLFEKTKIFLEALGYAKKLKLFLGDGTIGLMHHAPFDKIIVTAGAPAVPEALINQLKVGGVLVIPVGNDKTQQMQRITKTSISNFETETFDGFSFVPLIGKDGW